MRIFSKKSLAVASLLAVLLCAVWLLGDARHRKGLKNGAESNKEWTAEQYIMYRSNSTASMEAEKNDATDAATPNAVSGVENKSTFGYLAFIRELKDVSRSFGKPVVAAQWRKSFTPRRPDKVTLVSLLVCDGFKYPYLRVEEEYPANGLGGEPSSALVSVADHMVVQVSSDISDADFRRQVESEGWKVTKRLPVSGCYLVGFQQLSVDVLPEALDKVRWKWKEKCVAQADFLVTGAALPNDPDFGRTWGLANDGQTRGTPGVDIAARAAWEAQRGNASVVVGVIDSGVDYTHPDLAPNIWHNPGESGGGKENNGVDDDENGLVDDFRGWDFANDDNDPMDDHFHGTHCAGTIGAKGNDGTGICGVCWDVSLLPIKMLAPVKRANGTPTGGATVAPVSDALDSIAYARTMNVPITSNSWGGLMPVGETTFLPLLRGQIELSGAQGGLFVAAAGNDSHNNEATNLRAYPASFDLPNILSVAATDHKDNLASFSNYGSSRVHVAAPGVAIYSTFPMTRNSVLRALNMPAEYHTISGTSMACPHVAGVAALIRSTLPTANAIVIKQKIMDNVDSVTALNFKVATNGRLNADSALNGSVGSARIALKTWRTQEAPPHPNNTIFNPGETWQLKVFAENRGTDTAFGVTGLLTTSSPHITVNQHTSSFGTLGAKQIRNGSVEYSITISPTAPTPHVAELVFTFTNSTGSSWVSRNVITVYTMSSLIGVISDAVTGDPIAGAKAFVLGARDFSSANTGRNGVYNLPLVDGSGEVTAKAGGYFDGNSIVTSPVTPGNPTITRNIALDWVTPSILPSRIESDQLPDSGEVRILRLGARGSRALTWTAWTNAVEYAVETSGSPGGPTYEWNDISSTGQELEPGGWMLSCPIGFSFPFYGRSYQHAHLSPHGYMTLVADSLLYLTTESNTSLPSGTAPRVNSEMIAWMWSAFSPDDQSTVYVKQVNATTFAIQSSNVPFANNPAIRLTCQTVLKSDGSITIHYKTGAGNSVGTVGIQEATRTKGVTAYLDQALPRNEFSVRFRPMQSTPWLTLSQATGSTSPETATNINATFSSSGLQTGTYAASLVIETNSPSQSRLSVPLSLRVANTPTPAEPQWVRASDAEEFNDRIQVTWAASPGATAYEVQRRIHPTGTFTPVATVATTSYDDHDVPIGVTHSYRIIARTATISSMPSEYEVGIRGAALDTARVGFHPFGRISYSSGSILAVRVNWYENLPDLPGGAKLEFSDDDGDTFSTLGFWSSNGPTHFLHTGYPFAPGVAYIYRFTPDADSDFAIIESIMPQELAGAIPGDSVEGHAWAAAAFGESNLWNQSLAGDQADPDGDSIVNLMEYALGTSPLVSDLHQLPEFSLSRDPRTDVESPGLFGTITPVIPIYPTLQINKNPAAVNLDYTVEWSDNLEDWFSGRGYTETIYDQPDRMKVRSVLPYDRNKIQFLRLKVTQ